MASSAATWADVARLRMVAQRLVGEPFPSAAAVVEHLTCLQAQDFAQVRPAVALRSSSRSIDDVHAALAAGSVVRSWPMRGTLHLVPAQDMGWMLALTGAKMTPTAARVHAALGLTPQLRAVVTALTRELLAGRGLTRTELITAWRAAGHDLASPLASHLIRALALDQVIVFGPMAGRDQQLRLTQQWIAHPRRLGRDEAIAEWMLRYLTSHGPASVQDFCWWTKVGRTEVRPVLEEVTGQLESIMVDEIELWHDPGLLDRYAALRAECRRPLLVPGFDEILLGYGDRSATLAAEHVDLVVPGHNGIFAPVVLHHGIAVATWRRPEGGAATVTVTGFAELPPAVTRSLRALTRAYPHECHWLGWGSARDDRLGRDQGVVSAAACLPRR